jgi:hypothetical protein
MNSDLLELLPRSCPNTFAMEGIVLVKLIHFQRGCTLPLVVAMNLVEYDGIFITSRDLETVHVLLAGLGGPWFGLVHHAKHLIGSLCETMENFPWICILRELFLLLCTSVDR